MYLMEVLSGREEERRMKIGVGTLVQGLWEVLSSNPGTVYWMDIFHIYLLNEFVWKEENKQKRGRGWPI